ncbi:uncharacterized protein B0H18DRAFT_1118851 [Fomitopsis serialis]|uniref:uncharacterized protein n=1 Tax=Fomitopsis serialis TaxID=139415 RepID=UPI0020075F2C|nr:uncharacterized protein B0H18DRAFT_1118851 [Neoantrodia serialis]KAH9926793.1 hypothetical protein B0H18DRAFT_1118851 [Neoantrodia serialis]
MSAQASTSSTFVIPSVFTWSNTNQHDLEAQTISGRREHFDVQLSTPPVAFTHAPRTRAASLEEGTNAVDDFFGASSSRSPRGTQDSRHDAAALPVHHDDAPPPYSCSSAPPAYTRYAEHPTLAMYLFKFGFLFPLFWIAGALILIFPSAPPRTGSSRRRSRAGELIENMRGTEIKWAKRCLIALSVLILVVLTVVLAAVFLTRT